MCSVCEASFDTKEELKAHMKEAHEKEISDEEAEGMKETLEGE